MHQVCDGRSLSQRTGGWAKKGAVDQKGCCGSYCLLLLYFGQKLTVLQHKMTLRAESTQTLLSRSRLDLSRQQLTDWGGVTAVMFLHATKKTRFETTTPVATLVL